MDLWIRSQDKTFLMKIDNINLGLDVDSNKPCRLFTFVGGAVTSFTLGTYKSEERALEVLDEIQNLLIPKAIINTFDIEKKDLLDNNQYLIFENKVKDFSIEQFKTYVYKIPKE